MKVLRPKTRMDLFLTNSIQTFVEAINSPESEMNVLRQRKDNTLRLFLSSRQT